MTFKLNSTDLLDKISKYIVTEIEKYNLNIEQFETANNDKIRSLEETHQAELDKLIKTHNEELNAIESKLAALNQIEDLNKFQKKTIVTLNFEIENMKSTIISLEKRLKLADNLHTEKTGKATVHNDYQVAGSFDKTSMRSNSQRLPLDSASASARASASASASLSQPKTETDSDEMPELYPVTLKSGIYYCDVKTNELYEFVSDEEAGDILSTLKSVKIKNKIYYMDAIDLNFYTVNEDNTVGDHAGQVVNKKAIFKN